MEQKFDWEFYINNYKDLRDNGINTYEKALNHWNKFGRKEGRVGFKNINKDAVIFCMARDEKNYINEFIQYHLILGFDRIYLYDDEDIPIYKSLINPLWPVTVIPISSIKQYGSQRTKMLHHFFVNYKNKHYWATCIDVDEFIVLKKHNDIHEFLNEFIPLNGGVGINWVLFGSNEQKLYEDKAVLERFTRCGDPNVHIKTIFVCSDAREMQNPHFVSKYIAGSTKSTNGNVVNGPFNTNPDVSICQINHYHTKSSEEYSRKRQRGAGTLNNGRGLENSKHYDKNQFVSSDKNIYIDTFALEYFNKNKNILDKYSQ